MKKHVQSPYGGQIVRVNTVISGSTLAADITGFEIVCTHLQNATPLHAPRLSVAFNSDT